MKTVLHMIPKHFISASAIVLNQDKDILLIKGPRRGWEFPGGLVEIGEKITDALIREVREETGVEINNICFRGLYNDLEANTINFLFTAEYADGVLTTSEESLEVKFVSFEEARRLVTWQNFFERIENVFYENPPFMVEF